MGRPRCCFSTANFRRWNEDREEKLRRPPYGVRMRALYDLLGVLIKILAGLLIGMFALVVIGGTIFNWSGGNKERANYECVLRRMEAHIAEESTGVYHDTCMAAAGYRRLNVCSMSNLTADPPFCYAPGWQFWEK
jgi:hypothetical protein